MVEGFRFMVSGGVTVEGTLKVWETPIFLKRFIPKVRGDTFSYAMYKSERT